MKPEHALYRLSGVFDGFQHFLETHEEPPPTVRLQEWAHKQQKFIEQTLEEVEDER